MSKIKKIGCMIIIFQMCFCACSRKSEIYLEEYSETEKVARNLDTEVTETETVTEKETESVLCYVYVCGAVESPGVYALPKGSRIYEALQKAGGLTSEADEVLVNQAELLYDGMMIQIYTKEEAKEIQSVSNTGNMTESISSDGKVDINTANEAELMTLPGIGASKAEAIVTYRKECGGFSCIEELMNIPGIKEGIYQQLKEHIKVNN